MARRIDQQIDRVILDILAQPLADGDDEGGHAARLPVLVEAFDVGADRLIDLAVERGRRIPPQEKDEGAGGKAEEPGIDQREAEPRRAQETCPEAAETAQETGEGPRPGRGKGCERLQFRGPRH